MRRSAGLLCYRVPGDGVPVAETLEVLLVHPGGPFFARRDAGVWTIPKGEYEPDEEPYAAARREFTEETGAPPPEGEPLPLGEVKQRGGKLVIAWGYAGDLDADAIVSNTFPLEWPPRSGRFRQFPEVDRAGWFRVEDAREKINPAQAVFLDRLLAALTDTAS
ncbi:MAG: NUDIX domain-containing protein [Streptosporangiales bacterium]|nr:NUDIX domain-containing protein [Streptosporangiales bacterium]